MVAASKNYINVECAPPVYHQGENFAVGKHGELPRWRKIILTNNGLEHTKVGMVVRVSREDTLLCRMNPYFLIARTFGKVQTVDVWIYNLSNSYSFHQNILPTLSGGLGNASRDDWGRPSVLGELVPRSSLSVQFVRPRPR